MTKRINSYNDLLEEKERLESLLKIQKAVIREDIYQIGEEIEPVTSALSFAGRLLTRDNSNLLLNAGANKVIDIFIKKILLARTGWITKLVVPFLVKNYSSHFISENKGTLLKKLFSWIGKKNANGQEKIHED
jgi:hypothetical protein